MNNWSLPQCQRVLFFLRVQADLFCSAIFQVRAVFPDELSSPPCHRGRPSPPKGHKTVKIEATGQQWLHSIWEPWELDTIFKGSAGELWLCPLQRAHLRLWEYWEMVIDGTQPLNGMLEECSAGGPSGFQECMSLNDPPHFHIRTKIRSLRLHMV